jgi:putative DNA primase/helicase
MTTKLPHPETDARLTATDLAQHDALGIPPELLHAAGIVRVTDTEAREHFGLTAPASCALGGLVYPYVHVVTGARVTCRLRRDHPEVDAAGKPIAKYLAPHGDARHLFFAPGAGARLADPTALVVIVEAEKSVLALTAAAERVGRLVLAIGCGGCWGWRGRIGKTTDSTGARVDEKGPLLDLDRVVWTGRDCVILFDANVATNASVQAARRALADDLVGRGARVRLGALPAENGVNGPDDHIGKHGDAAVFALLDAATPARRPQDMPIADLLKAHSLTLDAVTNSTTDQLGARLRALALDLTGADRLRRALVMSELKKTCKLSASVVNAALNVGDDEADATTTTTSITLSDDEPSAEPVNGARLLDETAALIRRHVVLTEAQAIAVALWIGASYVIDALWLMAILLISAPTKRAGKTTLLTLLGALVPRALAASNLTGAVLARAIAAHHPTLLADEADTWLTDETSELRGIMNSGHTRETAYILRCAPETHEPQLIPCFGARVLAMIKRPPDTILDRAITIELRRRRADEPIARLRQDRLRAEHAPLRRQWRRWADDHLDAVRAADPALPSGLHDRATDNWRALVVVADLAGGPWPGRARQAAVSLAGGDEPESVSVELLADLQSIFVERDVDVLASADMVAALVALPDRRWADWSHGRPLTAAKLARLLWPYGIAPIDVKISGKNLKRYPRRALEDAWTRYVPSKALPRDPINVYGPESLEIEALPAEKVAPCETAIGPMFTESGSGVALSKADPGAHAPIADDQGDQGDAIEVDDASRY